MARVLVITARLGSEPWSTGPVARRVVDTLARAGHEVHLAADSVDDPAMFAGAVDVRVFRSYSQTSSDFPGGFARWVCDLKGRVTPRRTVSLCRGIVGDVWWPLEPTRAQWVRRTLGTRSLVGVAAHLAKHRAILRLRAAVTVRAGDGPVRTISEPAVSLMTRPGREDRVRRRGEARRALGIDAGARVVVLSATGGFGAWLDQPLRGLAWARGAAAEMVLLALVRDTFSFRRAVERAEAAGGGGLWARTRVIPPTAMMVDCLCAADVAIAALPAWGGPGVSGATGRFMADAMVMGLPIAAAAHAAGSELLARGLGPGFLVHNSRGRAWAEALERLAGMKRSEGAEGVPRVEEMVETWVVG